MGAVLIRDNAVLLVERAREPHKGYWSLPGGAVETGETLAEAVRREVREETGLLVEPLAVVEIFERILRDAQGRTEYHYVLIDYVCTVAGGDLAPADDVSQACWFPRGDLAGIRLTEGSLAVIEKAFRQLAQSVAP